MSQSLLAVKRTVTVIAFEYRGVGWRVEVLIQGLLTAKRAVTVPDNSFASTLLGVKAGEKKEQLPSLEHLYLSAVSFQSVGMAGRAKRWR